MNLKDLFIDFFESKGHVHIPSGPVVPENDNTVLFNTAGMQPLVPYLKGKEHPLGKRLCNYQKCIRTTDLEEVGDSYHHTFFEMLGSWSLGDYFKKEAIIWSYEFLTEVLNIPALKLAITYFAGNEIAPKDVESYKIWRSLGIPDERIVALVEDNWWPNLELPGLCGPDTEMFYWRSNDPVPKKFDPKDSRWVEIWNDVFMQYDHLEDGTIKELSNKNVDTGMGFERVTAILEGTDDNYTSSIFIDVINKIEEISNKKYKGNERYMRIIADHIRTAVFIAADYAGIKPSNVGQGYILRRLIRRAIRFAKELGIDLNSDFEKEIALIIISKYEKYYSEVKDNKLVVLEVLKQEKNKFVKTLEKGLKEFEKVANKDIDGKTAFRLYDTFGFPIEFTSELAKERNLKVDTDGFKECFKAHQELSRTTSAGQFKGGLGGSGEMETKYHTTTHLLNAALKKVLGNDVHQRGSNITSERLRFDFSFDRKLTDEEKTEIENVVNKWIKEDLPITFEQLPKEEALKSGAECEFANRYPDIVTVYSISNISKEICRGPHVKSTKEIGSFKITKEEASAAGIRRIRAEIK